MMNLASTLKNTLLSEAERWMLWLPVFIGCGIYLYFSLPSEPPFFMGSAAFSASISAMLLSRRWPVVKNVMIAMATLMLGFTAAQFQAHQLETTLLERPIPFTHLRGHLAKVIDTEEGMKLVIENPVAEKNWKPIELPKRIRLNLRKAQSNLAIGQEIRLRGGLFPLPLPAIPEGPDIARHFYFQGIGAVGYALPNIEIISDEAPTLWAEKLATLRQKISRIIRSNISGAAGAVADALITGEQAAIPKQVREEMSIAGIAHMLSISGLHLSLVAGIFFITLRQIFAFIPPLSLRFSIKKIAAFCALIGSFGYLALAGFPVAANRSFVMVALVLGAVIFDRQVLSMRSVAIAAIIILLAAPESLMGPSFQLSFAATTAIIALYERYKRKPLAGHFFDSWLFKPLFYLIGIALTSFVAGLATTPFVILHFHQLTIYHILTNVITSPLLSFLVMPAAILTVFGIPLGWEAAGLTLMQYGIEGILSLSQWVAALPLAETFMPSFPAWGVGLFTFGSLWLCFWRQQWRLAGIPLIIAGIASLWTVTLPDMLISPQAAQAVLRLPDGNYAMLKGGNRNFTAKIWAESLGFENYTSLKEPPEGTNWRCDALGCLYQQPPHLVISFPKRREAAAEDCIESSSNPANHFLMVADFYADCRGETIFSRPKQATALWFTPQKIVQKTAISYIERLKH